jgi:tRNA(fMet)-specific endonuclease VapC
VTETHRYLLDTNIVSALIKAPRGVVFQRLQAAMPATSCTSIVVAAEIHFGLSKGVSEKLRVQALQVIAALDVLPLDAPVDRHYGEIRAHLQRTGQPIGQNDLFIAAHARALGLVLVTNNVREFDKVPGLDVENWLAPAAP